jgi:SAM-dependent methyltransferase
MSDWFEDDSFWETMYPFLMTEERMENAPDEVISALSLIGFEGEDVLDLCCGVGRHTVELARQGFAVTGVDRSPFLLSKARERAEAEPVDVEWIESDMRDFVRAESYDLVLNMFTSFGYFEDKNDDLEVLGKIFANLRPGGKFLMDTFGKEQLAAVFQPTTSEVAPNGDMLIRRHEVRDDWCRIRNEWIVVSDGKATSFDFELTVYSAQELKDRISSVGFRQVRVFGDLRGSEYGPGLERLVVVAVR